MDWQKNTINHRKNVLTLDLENPEIREGITLRFDLENKEIVKGLGLSQEELDYLKENDIHLYWEDLISQFVLDYERGEATISAPSIKAIKEIIAEEIETEDVKLDFENPEIQKGIAFRFNLENAKIVKGLGLSQEELDYLYVKDIHLYWDNSSSLYFLDYVLGGLPVAASNMKEIKELIAEDMEADNVMEVKTDR